MCGAVDQVKFRLERIVKNVHQARLQMDVVNVIQNYQKVLPDLWVKHNSIL